MENVIRFDILHGRCSLCDGPVYFSRTIDWEGNRVNALQCWNGHYENIEVDHADFLHVRDLTKEEIEKILPFVGLVRLDDESKD